MRKIIVIDGEEVEEQVLDDQALWMEVEGVGPFVITGCAHAGPVNVLLQVKRLGNFKHIHGLLGGTHLVGRPENYIDQTVEELKQFGLNLISPCHCIGFKATVKLWQARALSFEGNSTLKLGSFPPSFHRLNIPLSDSIQQALKIISDG